MAIKSKLTVVDIQSPNKSSGRNSKIDTITPHILVANWDAQRGCEYFKSPSVKASANYVIGKDGEVGCCVYEEDRAWTSSSSANDNRAITVEMANYKNAPNYEVSEQVIQAFIVLCIDICHRYGFKGVYFDSDPKKPHAGGDKMRITLHRWFANKTCPGPYLESKIPHIVSKVNEAFAEKPKELYRVQVGAYSVEANAKAMAEKLRKAGFDTYIVKY